MHLTSPCEIILQIGAEGGSLTIYGRQTTRGWIFSRQLIDHSAELLDEPATNHRSDETASWPEAVALLASYPWHKLHPMVVHPEFREPVYQAVLERFGNTPNENRRSLPEWKELCGVV